MDGSLYYYTKGWNLKAVGCWVSAATFGILGLVGSYHTTWVAAGATEIYYMGWIITFFTSSVFYCVVNWFLPAKVMPDGYSQTVSGQSFEAFAATGGYLDGDELVVFPAIAVQDGVNSSADSTASQDVVDKA